MRSILAGAAFIRPLAVTAPCNRAAADEHLPKAADRRTTRDAPVSTTKSTNRPSTRLDLEVALTVAFKHQAATGRGRFTQTVGRLEDRGLRRGALFNRTIGKPGRIATCDNQPDIATLACEDQEGLNAIGAHACFYAW
jgi:hypothetical protein